MEPSLLCSTKQKKHQNCSSSMKQSLYKQPFHMKRMKKYRGAPANAHFILKLFWRRLSEMGSVKALGKKKKDCCNFFIAICTLSTKWFSPQKVLLFLWLISGSNGLCKSRSSLAKWIISNCFDFTFRLLVPPSAGWDCAWRWWQIPAGWGLVCVLLLWEQSLCYVLRCPGFALCYQKELCCLVRWIWSFDPPSSCSGPGKYQVHQ